MAEQTFRSPGFFDREIDLSQRKLAPSGIPAGIIGTAVRGPAFVPVTVGDFADFETKFGSLDPERFGPYAVNEFLKSKQACTYIRVLGCGNNNSTTHLDNFEKQGIVNNAGFIITGSTPAGVVKLAGEADYYNGRNDSVLQFLAAAHYVSASNETIGYPIFSDNDSFPGTSDGNDTIHLVRAALMTATGSTFRILNSFDTTYTTDLVRSDGAACIDQDSNGMPAFTFKLVLSNSDGINFGQSDGIAGIKIFTASLDPSSDFYISKILNTDPRKFRKEKHLLYADFSVSPEVAQLVTYDFNTVQKSIYLTSGSMRASQTSGNTSLNFIDAFGRFDTRYTTARTTKFISQPFGKKEWDLFHFETIDDGAVGNRRVKVSISNLQNSLDPTYEYGSFDVLVRDYYDTDIDPKVIERYAGCNLDPDSDRYIARVIGDRKASFNFDTLDPNEQRLTISGEFPNQSSYVRVIMTDEVRKKKVPGTSIPFGFRGIPALKTSDSLTDTLSSPLMDGLTQLGSTPVLNRQSTSVHSPNAGFSLITGSIIPPLPLRFKVTRGAMSAAGQWLGEPGQDERADSRFFWGVQTIDVPSSATFAQAILRPNEGTRYNSCVDSYTKFVGIEKLDVLVTGTATDLFNNNKFTLSRVALPNTLLGGHITQITGTAKQHMLGAAYVRNGQPDASDYLVKDTNFGGGSNRITLATLVNSSSVTFNKFKSYSKFTNIFYGGFDGLNILDEDMRLMNDRATSALAGSGGKAADDWTDTGLGTQPNGTSNPAGTLNNNNSNRAYAVATEILADQHISNINILAIPGIRTPYVTDEAMIKARDNGQIFYVMDAQPFDENGNRVFVKDQILHPDVRRTAEEFENQSIDNSYTATYFPDVHINDPVNNTVVRVPASVAAVGALAFNDKNAYPWFAPAGFSRGALTNVVNVDVRLSSEDRDTLYDARINPIATFPNSGFVIFGQKNLQAAKTARDRINVRRMLIGVKRLIVNVARNLLFEQNTPATRARFIANATPLLALVQAQQGIEQFSVVMDDSNNSTQDVENNRLNGRIIIVPTRTVEFVSIDFIITQTGVSFE